MESTAYNTPEPTDVDGEDWSSDQSFTPSTPSSGARSPTVRRRRPRRSSRHAPLTPQSTPRSRRGTMEFPSSGTTRRPRTNSSAYKAPRQKARRESHSGLAPNPYPPLSPLNHNHQPQQSPSRAVDAESHSTCGHKSSAVGGAPSWLSPVEEVNSVVGYICSFIRDIGSNALWLLRKPLAWLITLYLFAILISYSYAFLRNSVFSALSPICLLPGTGDLVFCVPNPNGSGQSPGNNRASSRATTAQFPLLMDLQGSFSTVLENSAGGSVMALDLKNSEMAVRDLNALVKSSDLSCKQDLSERLDSFVGAAQITSRSLTRFSSRVNGVVDSLLAMDEYVIRDLERAAAEIEARENSPSGIALGAVNALLAPFIQPQQDPRQRVLSSFLRATAMMDTGIRRLIMEAEAAMRSLDDLDNKLKTVSEIVAQEKSNLNAEESEVLLSIWTSLGGNRAKLANFRNHNILLEGVAEYKKTALKHVSTSLIMLQNMQGNLEVLREKVVEPGLERDKLERGIESEGSSGVDGGQMLLEIHVQSIRRGVKRLKDGMERAKNREDEYVRRVLGQHDESLKALEWETKGIKGS